MSEYDSLPLNPLGGSYISKEGHSSLHVDCRQLVKEHPYSTFKVAEIRNKPNDFTLTDENINASPFSVTAVEKTPLVNLLKEVATAITINNDDHHDLYQEISNQLSEQARPSPISSSNGHFKIASSINNGNPFFDWKLLPKEENTRLHQIRTELEKLPGFPSVEASPSCDIQGNIVKCTITPLSPDGLCLPSHTLQKNAIPPILKEVLTPSDVMRQEGYWRHSGWYVHPQDKYKGKKLVSLPPAHESTATGILAKNSLYLYPTNEKSGRFTGVYLGTNPPLRFSREDLSLHHAELGAELGAVLDKAKIAETSSLQFVYDPSDPNNMNTALVYDDQGKQFRDNNESPITVDLSKGKLGPFIQKSLENHNPRKADELVEHTNVVSKGSNAAFSGSPSVVGYRPYPFLQGPSPDARHPQNDSSRKSLRNAPAESTSLKPISRQNQDTISRHSPTPWDSPPPLPQAEASLWPSNVTSHTPPTEARLAAGSRPKRRLLNGVMPALRGILKPASSWFAKIKASFRGSPAHSQVAREASPNSELQYATPYGSWPTSSQVAREAPPNSDVQSANPYGSWPAHAQVAREDPTNSEVPPGKYGSSLKRRQPMNQQPRTRPPGSAKKETTDHTRGSR